MMSRSLARGLVLLTLLALESLLPLVRAQDAPHVSDGPRLSPGFRFSEKSGAELFAAACQGCHMPDARGAAGAASYPALANNGNLAASGYPVTIVVRGQRGMPAFGVMMSDDQVAEVVNYVRTHYGNQYPDAVTAEDVKLVRP